MDFLLVTNESMSHYVYVKDFDKKYFCKSCLQCFSSKNMLTERKVCLSINDGAQSVRLEKGTIEFKKFFNYQFHSNFMLILSVI